MATFATTNMDRVLRIPELLDMIFGFLDMRSSNENLGCITVCKQWSDIALDSLWRDVNSLRRLFHVLSPLQRRIGKSDWVSSQNTSTARRSHSSFDSGVCQTSRRERLEAF